MEIKNLEPQAVWKNFAKICETPHPSHHLEKITKMMIDFGRSLELETLIDKAGNILIRKPATPGYENRKTVVLQAHLDMVPQANSSVAHNFETDAIQPLIDGEWVRANQTTLGADNGIGAAAAMAVLDAKDLKHGEIAALFTVDEETGMYGAFGLQSGWIKGDILLNLDSEDEGELFIGCAGGLDAGITWKYNGVPAFDGDIALKITVSGLKGGHSGLEIHLGRGNANKLIFRFLKEVVVRYEARLAAVEGGNMRNAIPREAWAVITVPAEMKEEIAKLVEEYEELYNIEYQGIEYKISFTALEVEMPELLMPEEIQDDLINSVTACPNGVFRNIPSLPSVVETSMNLSIIKATAQNIDIQCLLRSSVDSKKEELASMVESVFTLAGGKVEFSGSYSGWNPNPDSPILKIMKEIYQKEFGKEPKVTVIHAGLECGIIGAVEPDLDMISFGPTIRHPHSPDEKVNIESVSKFWKFLTAVLENAPQKTEK
ncbi:MAG: aminoacyl-histidine dipeptidase [Prevotellaceae bacterium]|jgi:dipeptidase D|nr:aminoacyl-histidine dipeptidase [Prevotellaceae bacterium]